MRRRIANLAEEVGLIGLLGSLSRPLRFGYLLATNMADDDSRIIVSRLEGDDSGRDSV